MNGMLDFLRGKFVRTDRTPQVADSTADNIVSASASGKCPLHVQGIVGTNALTVSSAGTTRFSVDGNGTTVIGGQLRLTHTAASGALGTLTASQGRVVLAFDTSGGAGSVTLPAISALSGLSTVYIVLDASGNANTNNITVNANAADAINGVAAGTASKVISTQYGGLIFIPGIANKWRAYTLTPA